jgi:hypothetical protein
MEQDQYHLTFMSQKVFLKPKKYRETLIERHSLYAKQPQNLVSLNCKLFKNFTILFKLKAVPRAQAFVRIPFSNFFSNAKKYVSSTYYSLLKSIFVDTNINQVLMK